MFQGWGEVGTGGLGNANCSLNGQCPFSRMQLSLVQWETSLPVGTTRYDISTPIGDSPHLAIKVCRVDFSPSACSREGPDGIQADSVLLAD